jgi:hypothetical protein
MICEACHGQQIYPPCPECGGCGIAHCCDGLVECPSANHTTGNGEPPAGGDLAQRESVPFTRERS